MTGGGLNQRRVCTEQTAGGGRGGMARRAAAARPATAAAAGAGAGTATTGNRQRVDRLGGQPLRKWKLWNGVGSWKKSGRGAGRGLGNGKLALGCLGPGTRLWRRIRRVRPPTRAPLLGRRPGSDVGQSSLQLFVALGHGALGTWGRGLVLRRRPSLQGQQALLGSLELGPERVARTSEQVVVRFGTRPLLQRAGRVAGRICARPPPV